MQDHHLGLQIALPTNYLILKPAMTRNESRYASADGSIVIIATQFRPEDRPWRDLYASVVNSTSMKRVSSKVYRRDAFFVSGENETQDHYYTAKFDGAIIRGLSIVTPLARRPELSCVIIATANAFHNSMADYVAIASLIPPPSAVAGYIQRAEPSPAPPVPSRSSGPELSSTGSGFYVDRLGNILTNNHVISECESLYVKDVGVAEIVRRDPSNDLALIKITPKDPIEPARFREDELDLAERVISAGFPLFGKLASSLNITTGSVSSMLGLRNDGRYLQISAPVQNGNSGGPLLEASGRVAGVVTAKLNHLQQLKDSGSIPENIAFALRSSYALAFLRGARVTPIVDAATAAKSDTDVAKEAGRYTVLIGCFK